MRPNGGRFVVNSYNLVKWALFFSSLPLHSDLDWIIWYEARKFMRISVE